METQKVKPIFSAEEYESAVSKQKELDETYAALQDITPLSEGAYGCVFKAIKSNSDIKSYYEFDRNKYKAVKIQLKSNKAQSFKEEFMVQELSSHKTNLFLNPFVAIIFNVYALEYNRREYTRIMERFRDSKCKKFGEALEKNLSNNTQILTLIEMELYDRSLHQAMRERPNLFLNPKVVQSIILQLLFSFYSMQKELGIIHRDIHSGNILLKEIHHNMTLYVDPQNSYDLDLSGEVPLCAITDFGISTSIYSKTFSDSVTEDYPVNYFLNSHAKLVRGPQLDYWTLAMWICKMVLVDWKLPENHAGLKKFPVSFNSLMKPNYFWNRYEFYKKAMTELPEAILFGWYELMLKAQFQYYLGNGLVPPKYMLREAGLEITDMDVKKADYIKKNKDLVFEIGKSLTLNGSNIFNEMIKELKRRLGNKGLEIIRRLCSWIPFKGKRIEPMDYIYQSHNYLASIIKSSYFDTLRGSTHDLKYGYFEHSIQGVLAVLSESFNTNDTIGVCKIKEGKSILWNITRDESFCNHLHHTDDLLHYLENKKQTESLCPLHNS